MFIPHFTQLAQSEMGKEHGNVGNGWGNPDSSVDVTFIFTSWCMGGLLPGPCAEIVKTPEIIYC